MRLKGLALFAALQATFSDVHPYCDQIVQSSADAQGKALPGREGAKHCARHVATYTAGQAVAGWAVTRALGCRVPVRAWAAGHAVNALTHYVIDRREPFKKFLRSKAIGKGGYLAHATVQRREGVIDEGGPGTALMEMDQATHRLISVVASLVTTSIALHHGREVAV
ncbi:hypothetical protein ABZ639_17050 [Saccharomonospora sp. NPDC006951]